MTCGRRGGGVLARALALACAASGCGEREPPRAGGAVLRPDAAIELPGEPGRLLPGRSEVWVAQPGGIVRVRDERAGAPIRVGMDVGDLARGHGSLWLVGVVPGRERVTAKGVYPVVRVVRLDPATGRIVARIAVPARSNGNRLAVTRRHVWISDPAEGRRSSILRIDPETNRLERRGVPSGESPLALEVHAGAVWSANHDDGTLRRHDPGSGRTTARLRLPGEPHGLAVGREAIWVADAHHRRLLRIDHRGLAIVARTPLGYEPGALAEAGRGGVWVAAALDQRPQEIQRVEPASNRIADRVRTDAPVVDFTTHAGTLWATVTDPPRLLRVPEEGARQP